MENVFDEDPRNPWQLPLTWVRAHLGESPGSRPEHTGASTLGRATRSGARPRRVRTLSRLPGEQALTSLDLVWVGDVVASVDLGPTAALAVRSRGDPPQRVACLRDVLACRQRGSRRFGRPAVGARQGPRQARPGRHLPQGNRAPPSVPRAYLKRFGIAETRWINQIANMALVRWSDNIDISDRLRRVLASAGRTEGDQRTRPRSAAILARLLDGWQSLDYEEFLAAATGLWERSSATPSPGSSTTPRVRRAVQCSADLGDGHRGRSRLRAELRGRVGPDATEMIVRFELARVC